MKRKLALIAGGVVLAGAALVFTLARGPALDSTREPAVVVVAKPPTASVAPPAAAAVPVHAELDFDLVRVTPLGEVVIAGRGEAGARIGVVDGGRVIAETTADGHGEWVALPPAPLTPGPHELSLRARAPTTPQPIAPQPIAPPPIAPPPIVSRRVVVVVVPDRPSVDKGVGEAVALAVPSDGHGASAVLQPPGPAGSPPVAGAVQVETLDYDDAGRVALGGHGAPNGMVQLYLDNVLVGRAATDPAGHWRLSPERTVDPGLYTLRADQVEESGRVTARAELPVRVADARAAAATSAEGRIVVQPGDSLWLIARQTYGEGPRYTQIHRANRAQIRDPDLIYPGQIFTLPPTR